MFYQLKEDEKIKLHDIRIHNIQEDIQNKLLELNFNISNIGYRYWVIAIEFFVKHYEYAHKFQMEDIYCYIAETFDTIRVRVERNMRTLYQANRKELEKRYKTKTITTKKLLFLIGSEVFKEWKKNY